MTIPWQDGVLVSMETGSGGDGIGTTQPADVIRQKIVNTASEGIRARLVPKEASLAIAGGEETEGKRIFQVQEVPRDTSGKQLWDRKIPLVVEGDSPLTISAAQKLDSGTPIKIESTFTRNYEPWYFAVTDNPNPEEQTTSVYVVRLRPEEVQKQRAQLRLRKNPFIHIEMSKKFKLKPDGEQYQPIHQTQTEKSWQEF